ncbi:M16 family metallopeptidase [Streptomyces sp. NPDC008086]|uniref:M16 family metallopeptidase n=1 Tax=Streptomyces sp. NPDC008086 TaxID=3364807 RepID=UPI0036E75111
MSLRLDGGLRLVTEETPGRGLVAVALTVAAGGGDDPAGRHGMAHLVEHLMFPRNQSSGSASGSASGGDDDSFVALVQEVGGMCNAETHRDHTVFHTVVPADALPDILAHEARRLLRFEPSPATVRSEVAVIGEEIRAAGSGSRLWDTVLTALHPGARDAYGTTTDLRDATVGEAETFFRRHYRPERAVLSVVGDVDAGLVGELVEREFGAWGREACDREARDPGPADASDQVVRRELGGDEPRPAIPYGRNGVAVGHALADPRQGLGPYLAQVVLCELLRRERLRRLVAERGAVDAASVMCGYQGQWLASAAPDLALVLLGRAPGIGTEEAVGRWLDALAAVAAAPPNGPELRRAVTVLRAACHRQADSLTARAVTHGRAALLFPGDSEGAGPDALPRHLAAVTAADVSSAARALLAAPRTVHTLEGVAP